MNLFSLDERPPFWRLSLFFSPCRGSSLFCPFSSKVAARDFKKKEKMHAKCNGRSVCFSRSCGASGRGKRPLAPRRNGPVRMTRGCGAPSLFFFSPWMVSQNLGAWLWWRVQSNQKKKGKNESHQRARPPREKKAAKATAQSRHNRAAQGGKKGRAAAADAPAGGPFPREKIHYLLVSLFFDGLGHFFVERSLLLFVLCLDLFFF